MDKINIELDKTNDNVLEILKVLITLRKCI